MVSFDVVDPNNLSEQSKIWLELASEGFDGMFSVDVAMRQPSGLFFECNEKSEEKEKLAIILRGVVYVVFSYQGNTKILSLVMLGGCHLYEWADELRDFLYHLAEINNCDEFCYMGRKGFSRLFPELEECARVYRKILKPKAKILQ